jgi:hypothetical protein
VEQKDSETVHVASHGSLLVMHMSSSASGSCWGSSQCVSLAQYVCRPQLHCLFLPHKSVPGARGWGGRRGNGKRLIVEEEGNWPTTRTRCGFNLGVY